MAFIERADGTVYDTDIEREKKEYLEQKEKDAEYEKYMEKVRESLASNVGEWSPFQIF
ncbi:MAG: hypothetical protein ACI4F4_02700 [Lachnospiraceae bacterium]